MSNPYETQHNQVLGEYRLVRKLGGGGFSAVHLAEHIHEHSQVAIKILQVPLTKREDFRDFINETRTMIRLHHQHIIPLLDVGLSREDFPFLVMEYASEGTLRDRHPKGSQVPLATVAEYVGQIASALQYAHDHRVIHRDVKPENMLLHADGTLLLSDFGIAKIMEQSTLMSMQPQIGTPVYMAPEQHTGYPCFASDQYALAIVAYEWISGIRPFQGTSVGLAVQHMTAQPLSLLNRLPTLPLSIEQVIFKALSKAPQERFTTIQEFATALRTAIQESPPCEANIKKPFPAEPPAQETLNQLPITTSKHIESPSDTPPAPELPITDKPNEPEVEEIRQSPNRLNTPHPSEQPYTTQPATRTPTPLPTVTTEKPSSAAKPPRQLSPLKRNLALLASTLLLGLLILALFINMMGIELQKTQKSSNTGPIVSAKNETVLNASTVSRLVKKWTFQTEGSVESSPAVVGKTVYIGSNDNNVYAIDAQSGQKKWAFPTGNSVVSSPAVVDGVVYIGSDDYNVYAIDAQSGKQKWVFQTENVVPSSPAVVDGVLYISSQDGKAYAIDAQSGKQKWAFQIESSVSPPAQRPPPPVSSLPAVVDGVVYIGAPNSSVYAIDALSGQQKWIFRTQGFLVSSPAVADRVVYIGSLDEPGSFDTHIYAIDALSGLKKWDLHMTDPASSFRQGPPHGPPPHRPPAVTSSPVVVGGIVYIGSDNSKVYALDAQSGTKKWTFPAKGPVVSSPAVVNGVVYVGSLDRPNINDTNVYAIDAESGLKKWAFQTGGAIISSPAVLNNAVYIGSTDGNVYAFGLPPSTNP